MAIAQYGRNTGRCKPKNRRRGRFAQDFAIAHLPLRRGVDTIVSEMAAAGPEKVTIRGPAGMFCARFKERCPHD